MSIMVRICAGGERPRQGGLDGRRHGGAASAAAARAHDARGRSAEASVAGAHLERPRGASGGLRRTAPGGHGGGHAEAAGRGPAGVVKT